MQEVKRNNMSKERKLKLKEEKKKYMPRFKLPSTSKLILFVVFLVCIEILIFCEYAMIALGDTSAMYVLIGIPASLIPIIMSYYSKSKAENTVGGVVFETAMKEKENIENTEDVCG